MPPVTCIVAGSETVTVHLIPSGSLQQKQTNTFEVSCGVIVTLERVITIMTGGTGGGGVELGGSSVLLEGSTPPHHSLKQALVLCALLHHKTIETGIPLSEGL